MSAKVCLWRMEFVSGGIYRVETITEPTLLDAVVHTLRHFPDADFSSATCVAASYPTGVAPPTPKR